MDLDVGAIDFGDVQGALLVRLVADLGDLSHHGVVDLDEAALCQPVAAGVFIGEEGRPLGGLGQQVGRAQPQQHAHARRQGHHHK